MFFSPITERSLRVKILYGAFYLALLVGGFSIVMPLLILVTYSFEPVPGRKAVQFYPAYLFDDQELWRGYLLAKYNQSEPSLRQAWNDETLSGDELPPPSAPNPAAVQLWKEFRESQNQRALDEGAGFLGTTRLPQKNRRLFSRTVSKNYGNDIDVLNRTLDTQFSSINSVAPPVIGLVGAPLIKGTHVEEYLSFVTTLPLSERTIQNCGGYYRTAFLPRVIGGPIGMFNQKYGTNYASYMEVPFGASAPKAGADEWFMLAAKVLRPDYVELTESGKARHAASGLGKAEFIRQQSKPEDLRIRTLDLDYAEWALAKGLTNLEIPQKELDSYYFHQEKNQWKWTFMKQNYVCVLDEILLQGNAIKNTIILVVLSVAGTLLVNPLAAYALSRYRPRLTYQIILFCLVTVALPSEVTMIPMFLQLREFGLLNTFGALIIPGLASGFSIFLLKGFFDSLPRELYEAAELDGASEWVMFWQLTMNLSRPILAVLALGAFVNAYGAFMFALILCPDPKMWTIMVHLFQLMQRMDTPVLYAGLIISAIPTTLVFIFCQNIIMRGIVVPVEK